MATPQSAKHGSSVLARTTSESEKEGRNVPKTQKGSAGILLATLPPPEPQSRATTAVTDRPPQVRAQELTGRPPIIQLKDATVGSSEGSSLQPRAGQPQPKGDVKEPAGGIAVGSAAFALRLTPQSAVQSNGVRVSLPTATSNAPALKLTAPAVRLTDDVTNNAKPVLRPDSAVRLADPPSLPILSPGPTVVAGARPAAVSPLPLAVTPSPSNFEALSVSRRQNVDPGSTPENVRPRNRPREFAQRDIEPPNPQESDSLSRDPEFVVLPTATREPLPVPNSGAAVPQGKAGGHVDSVDRESARETDKGQTRPATWEESGQASTTLRPQLPITEGSTSVSRQAVPPREQGNSQGQDKNDPEPGAKAPKLPTAEKSATNPKDIHAPDGTGLPGVLPPQISSTGRTSPRTEAPSHDSPGSAGIPTQIETNLTVRPQPIREISLKLADGGSSQVDIQVVQRSGNVRVAVRTADEELTKSLQTNLGELVGRLEERGYKTETWIPTAAVHGDAAMTNAGYNSGHSHDQPEHSGSWAGQQQQRQEQQESGRRQAARWMSQFEQTLDGEGAGTEGITMEDR